MPRWLSKLRRRRSSPSHHEYVPEGWTRARLDTAIKGWNVEAVPQAQARWLAQLTGQLESTRPLGVRSTSGSYSPGDVSDHNTAVSFSYVAALAATAALAKGRKKLSLLDWGGGVGQYGLIARAALPHVELDYCCKEVPVQCELGRRVQPEATFFTSDDQFAGRKFDLVFASGALHYAENWREVLVRLAAATSEYLFVTRQPTVLVAPSYVVLQRAYAHGYDTEYLGWCLNRDEFLAAAESSGLSLVREFILGESAEVAGAPEPYQVRGFLLRPDPRPLTPDP